MGVWLLRRLLTAVQSRLGVTTECAARIAVGSGGCSTAFAVALSPAPVTINATLGFDGASRPFSLGLSSTPIATRAARCTALPE